MELSAYNHRSGIHNKKKFASVEDKRPKDKDYLYCEVCKSSFVNECEVHGPAVFIPDTPVPMGVAHRARQTLPAGLEIRKSSIPDSGLGVFNNGETVPLGAHFGPYQGELVDREEALNSAYSWVITKSREHKEYIDGTREMYANWMRYVNCAHNEGEQNLVAFQFRDRILYRCCQSIKPGQELLVWYEENYARDLGVTFHSVWNKKCSRNKMNNAALQVFSCTLCSLCYTADIYLHKHMKRCHYEEYVRLQKAGEINHPNDKRSSSDKQQTSSSHLSPKTAQEQIHQCSECGKNFKLHSYLKQHQCIHMGEKPHQCSQCGKSFTRQTHLKLHQRVHTGERPYRCSWCTKSFTDQSAARRHERTHTGEKPYHCLECGMNFTRYSNLRRHQRIHTGKKPYPCPDCGKSFTDQTMLRAHQLVHTGARPYPCSQCGLSFGHQGTLKQHQRVHTGEKPYPCSQCGKCFAQKGHLKLHLRIHTGEKPYHCSECSRTFNQMSNLKRHIRIHKGEKPYPCLQCGRRFTQQTTLQLHRRTHTGEKPYCCSECGKSFAHRSTFRIHQRSHTGERPYFCSQCSKSFISLGSLQRHQRVHTRETPYQCPQCGESFTQSCHLKYHPLSYTGDSYRSPPRGQALL